jgi:RNA polymerase-binding transcription factor DksA
MRKALIKEQKEHLLKEKREIEKALSSFAKKGGGGRGDWKTNFPQFGSHTSEQDENADEVEEYVNLLPVEHRLELRLLDIKRALEKLEKGKNYGICEKCGKKVKEQRLKTIPETKFCSECAKI